MNYCEFLKPKVGSNILPISRVCHNRSFLLTLALKFRTCVMALLVSTWLKFSPDVIKIMVPYRLPMGSWLGIGTSTILDPSLKQGRWVLHGYFSYYPTSPRIWSTWLVWDGSQIQIDTLANFLLWICNAHMIVFIIIKEKKICAH